MAGPGDDEGGPMSATPQRSESLATPTGGVLAEPVGWRRALGLLWLGQVVSHLGDALFMVAAFFLALEVTGSKSKSGLLVAMNFLPALALGLFAGAFVDRYDRRRMMVAADLLRAAAVGSIPVLYLTGHLGTLPLAISMFALATGTTVFNPAIKALIPEIAPLPRLTASVALFQVSEYVALMLGPVLAAIALPRLGMIHLFTLDAVTFLFSAGCLMLVPAGARRQMHGGPRSGPRPSVRQLAGAILQEVRVGLDAVRGSPVLRPILVLAAVDNLLIMGLVHVGTPLLVKETLGLGPDAYARAQTFFVLGLATASAAVWLFARNVPKGRLILMGIILDGLTLVPLALCRTLPELQLAQFVHAMAIPLIIIPRTVLIQQLVPGPLHGRAFALLNVTVFGMTAISSALVGVLAERVAPQTLFLVFGLLGILPGVAGFGSRALRSTR